MKQDHTTGEEVYDEAMPARKRKIAKSAARAFQRRWSLVNEAEREELRTAPAELKFRQLEALMSAAGLLGRGRLFPEDEAEVRERWQRLRKGYRG